MQLYSAFSRAKLRPGEYGKAEVYSGGVKNIERVLKSELVLGRYILAACKQSVKQLFKDAAGAIFIGVG